MKKVLVRYKLKEASVAENERLVKAVYKELQEANLQGFHYITLKQSDGVSFVHMAFADSEEINHTFSSLPAFKNFQAGIKERCEEIPVVGAVEEIGSYNFV